MIVFLLKYLRQTDRGNVVNERKILKEKLLLIIWVNVIEMCVKFLFVAFLSMIIISTTMTRYFHSIHFLMKKNVYNPLKAWVNHFFIFQWYTIFIYRTKLYDNVVNYFYSIDLCKKNNNKEKKTFGMGFFNSINCNIFIVLFHWINLLSKMAQNSVYTCLSLFLDQW